jgi:membrane associated rhomboid family serine protease
MFFPYKDDNPRVLVPYVNYVIIGLNIIVFTGQTMLSLPDPRIGVALINVFGFIPGQFNFLDILTSMFMHGGLFHIMGNMWFLWIFGDNVESALGHIRYIGFYLFCGFGAAFGQFLIDPSSPIPMVGASGAIAGVLGAYMLLYPRAKVHVLIVFFLITTIAVPAQIAIGVWFLIQLTNGLGSLGLNTGGVAWFAHVGGFAVGAATQKIFRTFRIE